MSSRIWRPIAAIVIFLLWLLTISLNLNGHFLVLTEIFYYIFALLHLILVIPDFLFFFKEQPGDLSEKFQKFTKGSYRLIFCVAFIFVTLEVATSLVIKRDYKFHSDLLKCINKEPIKLKNSIPFIHSFNVIKNNRIENYDISINVEIDSKRSLVNVIKKDGKVKCELK